MGPAARKRCKPVAKMWHIFVFNENYERLKCFQAMGATGGESLVVIVKIRRIRRQDFWRDKGFGSCGVKASFFSFRILK